MVAGDFSLPDWQPVFALTNGTLPRVAVDDAYRSRINSRGLFAATQFQAAQDGTVTFILHGLVQGVWLDGVRHKPAATFATAVKRGTHTLVFQLDDKTPADVKLTSREVAFVVE